MTAPAPATAPQILTVDLGARSYDIQVGCGLLDHNPALQALADGRSVAIISDSHVDPLHGERVQALLAPVAHQVARVVVPAGEASKCWQQLDAIHDALLAARFDRKSLIVALGGGVVGDLAGFAAASFQRGIDFVQITLIMFRSSQISREATERLKRLSVSSYRISSRVHALFKRRSERTIPT